MSSHAEFTRRSLMSTRIENPTQSSRPSSLFIFTKLAYQFQHTMEIHKYSVLFSIKLLSVPTNTTFAINICYLTAANKYIASVSTMRPESPYQS